MTCTHPCTSVGGEGGGAAALSYQSFRQHGGFRQRGGTAGRARAAQEVRLVGFQADMGELLLGVQAAQRVWRVGVQAAGWVRLVGIQAAWGLQLIDVQAAQDTLGGLTWKSETQRGSRLPLQCAAAQLPRRVPDCGADPEQNPKLCLLG